MAAIADGAIDGKGIISALQVPDERIALKRYPRSLLEGCEAGKELGGGTHANTEWHGHSAETQSRLLPTAVDQRLYLVLKIAAIDTPEPRAAEVCEPGAELKPQQVGTAQR